LIRLVRMSKAEGRQVQLDEQIEYGVRNSGRCVSGFGTRDMSLQESRKQEGHFEAGMGDASREKWMTSSWPSRSGGIFRSLEYRDHRIHCLRRLPIMNINE
jgi:hypothetical protein